MSYKIGDTVKILDSARCSEWFSNGDIGVITHITNGQVWASFNKGHTSWCIHVESGSNSWNRFFEVLSSASEIELKIKKVIFSAESVAHLQGYEREILPSTDLIRQMVDILKSCGKLDEVKL